MSTRNSCWKCQWIEAPEWGRMVIKLSSTRYQPETQWHQPTVFQSWSFLTLENNKTENSYLSSLMHGPLKCLIFLSNIGSVISAHQIPPQTNDTVSIIRIICPLLFPHFTCVHPLSGLITNEFCWLDRCMHSAFPQESAFFLFRDLKISVQLLMRLW